ncbi:MAG: hypothetical protein N2167_00835 [Flavobacteriales bacterium]|nr:hypothetical protein [Flavobacteriales bacterium]
MINRLRYIYRRLLLKLIPARAYVLEVGVPPHELILKLREIIHPDKMYFLFPTKTDKPYSGKFSVNKFVAIKNNTGNFQRPIKVSGYFYIIQNRIYVRIIMSNPFSILNIMVVGLFYSILLLFRVFPFESWWLNVLLWITPMVLTYIFTNVSFQRLYRKEKWRFFKLLNGRRLTDKEIQMIRI